MYLSFSLSLYIYIYMYIYTHIGAIGPAVLCSPASAAKAPTSERRTSKTATCCSQ